MNERDKEYLIRELISAGSMLVTLWIIKKMHSADTGRTIKMMVSRAVKRIAQDQADSWQKVADIAATSYQKARL